MPIEITDKTTRGPRMARRRGGVARTIDVQRLAKALASEGIDTRFWVSAGTVGVLEDDGTFKTDRDAIFADRKGAVVDVRLEPKGVFVTARWSGLGCGRFGCILIPITPGDEVAVMFPNGKLNSASLSIVAMLSNETAKIPADWNNDRVLFDLNVALEIRAPFLSLRSGNLRINGRQVNPGADPI